MIADRRECEQRTTKDQEPIDLETHLAEVLARGIVSSTQIAVSSGFHDLSFALLEHRLARRNRRFRPLRTTLIILGMVLSGICAYCLRDRPANSQEPRQHERAECRPRRDTGACSVAPLT